MIYFRSVVAFWICGFIAWCGQGTSNAQVENFNSQVQTVLSRDAATALCVPRTWTNSRGESLGEFTLETIKEGIVHLKRDHDGNLKIPMAEMSSDDQAILLEIAARKKPVIYVPVGDTGEMRIRYDWFDVAIPKGGFRGSLKFLNISYRENGENQDLTGGYIKANGVDTKIVVTSSKEDIVQIGQDERPAGTGYTFTFKAAGQCSIRIQVGEQITVIIPFEVVELQVAKGDSIQAVIDAYGLPDEKKNVITSWPHTEMEDDVIYKPSASEGTTAAQHWSYETLAPALISIVDDKVYEVGLSDEFSLSTADEGSRWSQGEYDGITKRIVEQEKAAAEPDDLERKRKEEIKSPRKWKDKSGKFSTTATYRGRMGDKVILLKEDGKKLYIPLSSLSEDDQAWIRGLPR